jgi:LPXTG-motif cell wall-anchored protein
VLAGLFEPKGGRRLIVKVRFGLVAVFAVVLVIAFAAMASAASVSMGDNFYSPTTVTIPVGDSVTWTNNGQAPHTVTADNGSFDSSPDCPGNINSCMFNGDTYTRTFNSAGTFGYTCKVHGASMSGTVVVQADGTAPGPGDPGGDLPNTGPSDATMIILALGTGLLVGGATLALVLRRRRA